MTWKDRETARRAFRTVAVALLSLGAFGCGGTETGGPAVAAKAAAVEVTYYYLPG